MMMHVSRISRLQIQGGEPFLYDQLGSLLLYLQCIDKIRHIQIATNGTITPLPRTTGAGHISLIKALQNEKTELRISNYGDITRKQVATLTDWCQEHEINYRTYDFIAGDGTWYDKGGPDATGDEDDAVVKQRFDECPNTKCLTLENGVIGYCSRSTIAPFVQAFTPRPNDYVRVERGVLMGLKLANYVYRPHVMECCRYCQGAGGRKVPPAIQME